LKPPETADATPSAKAVEDLKFAVANEGMRPIPLKNFLAAHGMNPKARLPPLRTITPGTGAMVPLGQVAVDMEEAKIPEADAPAEPPAPKNPEIWMPEGYEVTAPPSTVEIKNPGDLRQMLTTPPPPEEIIEVAAAPAPAGAPAPAVASTTLMMMIAPDAYAVNSVRPPVNLVRSADGHILECSQCKCVKHVNGGVENVKDPACM